MIWIFIVCTIVNVILSTIRSLTTIKGGKMLAACTNAITYGFYTFVIVLTADGALDVWVKALVTAAANFIGVFIVKFIEEKLRKDRLWKIEFTVLAPLTTDVDAALDKMPHSYISISPKHTLFNVYCETQVQSAFVRDLIKQYNAKYFASETKIL